MATQIFISHITAEHELAGLLKQRIEKHFLEQVDVFVSSDQESIQAGEPWLAALRNLTTASMAIVLCSAASVGRPWLNFEAGAAWLRQIPVVPLCHSGLEPDKLPLPLSALQGGQVADPDTLIRLYRRIATLVPCGCPDLDWTNYAGELARMTTAGPAGTADPGASGQRQPALDDLRRIAEAGDEKAIPAIAVLQSPEAWSVLTDIASITLTTSSGSLR
jgi:hypothetical protein